MNELSSILEFSEETILGLREIGLRLVISGFLGAVIALQYRRARSQTERNPGLFPTLILLSLLITLVTLAVGSNVAVAFTLVGTLAIVRFRTTVSDVRDTAFVIFAVAVGIAVGQSLMIAAMGVLVIGIAVEILHQSGTLRDRDGGGSGPTASATLRISIAPPMADPAIYEPVLERFEATASIVSTSVDRDRGRMRLTFRLAGVPARDMPALVAALLERPEVTDASVEI